MLPSGGTISLQDVTCEIGNVPNTYIDMNTPAVRAMAGRPSGTIWMSDLHGKRHRPAYFLLGNATTVERGTSYDTGDVWQDWFYIPRNAIMNSRVWASTVGSNDNNGPAGYVHIRWIIKDLWNNVLWDGVVINAYTSGDGSTGIGQWSRQNRISDLVGGGDHVRVTTLTRFISGDYSGHIDGGTGQVHRINGIEVNVGFY